MAFFLVLGRKGAVSNASGNSGIASMSGPTVDVHGLKIGIFTFHFVSGFPVTPQFAGLWRRKKSITDTRTENPIVLEYLCQIAHMAIPCITAYHSHKQPMFTYKCRLEMCYLSLYLDR
jgi:hypothetical protein